MLAIGIDLGGTKTNLGLIEIKKEKFKIIKNVSVSSSQAKEKLIGTVVENIKKIKNKRVERIGLALAGQINLKKKISVLSPNIKVLEEISFSQILKKEFGLPVYIDNDANAFVLAETRYGVAAGKQKVVGLTLGTGIGGGVIMDGKLYHGAYTTASELGHMIIDYNGRDCSCGQKGCLEAYASATALVQEYERRTGFKRDTYGIQEEAQAGVEPAKSVLEEAAHFLAVGIANIIRILEPEMVVLGGGLSKVENFINPAIANTKKLTRYSLGEEVKIVKAKLGIEAGMIGAALLE